MLSPTILHRRIIAPSAFRALLAGTALFTLRPAAAQEVPFVGAEKPSPVPAATLTRDKLVSLVLKSPKARAGGAQVGVAKAAAQAAGVAGLENPVLSATGGLRFNEDGSRPFAATATLAWPVELGGKRRARSEAAQAELQAAEVTLDLETRELIATALLQHALVLRHERELRIARARQENAEKMLSSAVRRQQAGSAPQLDVSLATLQVGREAASAATLEGQRDADVAKLAAWLGLAANALPQADGPLVPEGDPPPLEALLKQADQSLPVRRAAARVRAARARAKSEQAAASPTFQLLAQYERDDGANIGTVGLSMPLPILNSNTYGKATSSAEARAAEAEYDATRAAAEGELRELYARYEASRKALERLSPTASAAEEAVRIAIRSYELGESDLASVLLVHREALEAERALLELEHQHAEAKILLLVAAGRIPR